MRALFFDAPRPIPAGYEAPPPSSSREVPLPPRPAASTTPDAARFAAQDADARRRLEGINAANRAFYAHPAGRVP